MSIAPDTPVIYLILVGQIYLNPLQFIITVGEEDKDEEDEEGAVRTSVTRHKV